MGGCSGAISGAGRYLINFGGHELAAGFSVPVDNFLKFKEKLYTLISQPEHNNSRVSGLLENKFIELSLSESLDRNLLDNLMHLEPTGEANPKPLFLDRSARFVSCSTFGKNRAHLKGVIRGKYKNIPVIGFNLANKINEVDVKDSVSVLYTHSLDYYNGRTNWKVHIKDLI